MIKNFFLLFLSLCCTFTYAQEVNKSKNEIRLNLVKLELVPESVNDIYVPKWINSLVYKRLLGKRLRVLTGIEYGNRKIKDNNNRYQNSFEGTGRLKELRVKSGFSFHFNEIWKLIPFIEGLLYTSWSEYSGDFLSTYDQYKLSVDNTYIKFGGILKFGISNKISENLMFNGAFGVRMEMSDLNELSKTNISTETADRTKTIVPFEFSISYFF